MLNATRQMNNHSPTTTSATPVKAKFVPADDDSSTSCSSASSFTSPQKKEPSTSMAEKIAEVVTPSPRKRSLPTDFVEDLDLMILRRCPAWSEDDDEVPSERSRKRARVSFRLELSQKTKFEPDIFGRVTPIHWESMVSKTESIDQALRRAAAEK
jgi:hypothetical protein